ncbi:MAG: hypothetical protein IJD70_06080 [Clostridia bacterium]|nr:hypothetical protein [Clostridia bacterium]
MMDISKKVIRLNDSIAFSDSFDGCYAIDVTEICFGNLEFDPWETMQSLREYYHGARLMLTLSGQSLLGMRHYSDEIVEFFIAAAYENGIDIFRIYDALGDARNLETAARAVKKYGAHLQASMIYSESSAHSVSFFAGYAAQLAAMGADSICICGMSNEYSCRDLVSAVAASSSLPVAVSASSERIADIADDSGSVAVDVYDVADRSADLLQEIAHIRDDAGSPPMAYPISEIISEQARINCNSDERYSIVTEEFRSLILGKYGKTPSPVSHEFVNKICGSEPLVLVRPADMLEPEYHVFRDAVSPWFEQGEDILTYALFDNRAVDYFERRKAKKYNIDLIHSDPEKGIHVI